MAAQEKQTEDPSIALFREHSKRVRAQVDASRDSCGKDAESLSSTLARWLMLHFTVTAQRLAQAAGEEGLPLEDLQKLTACLVALRKGDHAREWMELERQRLKLAQESSKERMEAKFEKWVLRPEVQERFRPKSKMTPEEKERAIKAVFGITADIPPYRPSQPPPAAVEKAPTAPPPLEGDAPSAPTSPSPRNAPAALSTNGDAPAPSAQSEADRSLTQTQSLSPSNGSNGSAPTLKGDTGNQPPTRSAPTSPSPKSAPAIPTAGPNWPTMPSAILQPGVTYHFSSTSAFPFP